MRRARALAIVLLPHDEWPSIAIVISFCSISFCFVGTRRALSAGCVARLWLAGVVARLWLAGCGARLWLAGCVARLWLAGVGAHLWLAGVVARLWLAGVVASLRSLVLSLRCARWCCRSPVARWLCLDYLEGLENLEPLTTNLQAQLAYNNAKIMFFFQSHTNFPKLP